MNEQYINVREEMELIKTYQQMLLADGTYGNEREVWKLEIVWEYMRDRLLGSADKSTMH